MPEGPEILYWSVLLKKKLSLKYKFNDIKSFTDKPIIVPKDWDGKILDVGSKGKLLWLEVSSTDKNNNYYMHIHYGITGWFAFDKPLTNIKFEFVLSNITNSNEQINLYMEDRRRFSKIVIYNEKQHKINISKLGIDIFNQDFTLDNFQKILNNKNTILASFLLKQEIFCGIGNYIKNEVMYLTKLKAKIKTSELDNEQIIKLYQNILFVAYSNLVEMLKDNKILKYLDKSKSTYMPKKLEIPYVYKVYGREKTLDGKKIFKIKVSGRDTYCIKELC
jgi:formamidopyrimidine-DNA glycosylase